MKSFSSPVALSASLLSVAVPMSQVAPSFAEITRPVVFYNSQSAELEVSAFANTDDYHPFDEDCLEGSFDLGAFEVLESDVQQLKIIDASISTRLLMDADWQHGETAWGGSVAAYIELVAHPGCTYGPNCAGSNPITLEPGPIPISGMSKQTDIHDNKDDATDHLAYTSTNQATFVLVGAPDTSYYLQAKIYLKAQAAQSDDDANLDDHRLINNVWEEDDNNRRLKNYSRSLQYSRASMWVDRFVIVVEDAQVGF